MSVHTPHQKVFKLNHDELAAYLPEAEFESLESALSCISRAMNHDQTRNEKVLRADLHQALSVLQNPPLEVVKDIREWALEGLIDSSTVELAEMGSLHSPALLTDGSSLIQKNQRQLTARQARLILANVFFANCHDVMGNKKEHWNRGGLDWRPLLEGNVIGIERMKCHLLYFEASSIQKRASASNLDHDDSRIIQFERVHYDSTMHRKVLQSTGTDTGRPPVGTGVVMHNNPMETPTRPCQAFVNFANANFGYGTFIPSATQEEILLSCCPEIMIGMLWIGMMRDDEVVLTRDVRRFSTFTGYQRSFRCHGPAETPVIQDILTMDAWPNNHFSSASINRDVNKALASYLTLGDTWDNESKPLVVSTGKWGCGVFGGLTAHKFVQSALAANLAGVELEFSAFGNAEQCDLVLAAMDKSKPTANVVADALCACKDRQEFVSDFISFIQSGGTEKKREMKVSSSNSIEGLDV